ncbi:MAG: hypothetical protein L3K13_05070 [Thermoplasmata archaeon]|nr:hypothetical protein [Thermoplasmata archaeon]
MRARLAVGVRRGTHVLPIASAGIVLLFLLPTGMGTPFGIGAPRPSETTLVHPGPLSVAPSAQVGSATGFGPTISSFTATPNPLGEGGSATIRTFAYGGTGLLSYANPRLPPGCAASNTSVLSCTPTANGSYPTEVQVTDGSGSSAFSNLTLNVLSPQFLRLFVANSSVGADPVGKQLCEYQNSPPFYSSTCYPQAQQPTLLPLPNGDVGLAYSLFTNSTTNLCAGAVGNTTSRVEFAVSGDGGQQFGTPVDLGNESCAYLDALEPAFAVSGPTVYGVFVEANASSATLPSAYSQRSSDGLALVVGSQNGTHWSAPRTILAGSGLARPSLAVHGSTLYVAFEQLANSSVPIPGGVLPIAVQFLASTDGGARWSSPTILPGLNASQQYDALSPSVAVGPTGTVAVLYATNRSCTNATALGGGCAGFWDDVVEVASSTNGSSWGPLLPAVARVGENECASSGCWSGYYQSTPQIAASYDNAGDLVVAVAGGQFSFSFQTQSWYRWTGVEVAVQLSGSSLFTTTPLASPYLGGSTNYFDPGLGVYNRNVYVAFSADNESVGTGTLAGSLSTWVSNVTVAAHPSWSSPTLLRLLKLPPGRATNSTAQSFVGYSSSVAFNGTGAPYVGFSQAGAPVTVVQHGPGYYYTNVSYPTNLSVAFLASSANPSFWTTLTVASKGLPANSSWSLSVNGLRLTSNAPGLYLEQVPRGTPILLLPGTVNLGAWTNVTDTSTLPAIATLSSPAHEVIQFAQQFGFAAYPASLPRVLNGNYAYIEISGSASGTVPGLGFYSMSFHWSFDCNPPYYCSSYVYGYADIYNGSGYQYLYYTSYPIYVPKGLAFPIYVYEDGAPAPSYANGTGLGAFNGRMLCTGYCTNNYGDWKTAGKVSIQSPGNESIWFGGAIQNTTYNLTLAPEGLPAGTPYRFEFAGSPYSGISPTAVVLLHLAVGGYEVTDLSAASTVPGWAYFGSVVGGEPVVVPFEPNVTLRFGALVNLSAPPRSVSFHAENLTAGTSWRLELNGTRLGASVPWINASLRPGTYSLSASPATGPSGNEGFLPVGVGPTVTLGAGTVGVNLSFVPSYRLDATSSLGGDLSVNGGTPTSSASLWAIPGARVNLLATPFPGYLFLGWNGTGTGNYSGSSPAAVATVSTPIREVASFLALPGARFNLTFEEFGLAPGTRWGVSLDGSTFTGNGSSLTVSGLYAFTSGRQGSYALYVPPAYANGSGLQRFLPGSVPTVVGTNGSGTPPVVVQFSGVGAVSVAATVGGSASVSSGGVRGSLVWVPNGTPAMLAESPLTGYGFAGWSGSGAGSYTGNQSSPTLNPAGSPIQELAAFTPNPRAPSPTYAVTFFAPVGASLSIAWAFQLAGAPELITSDSLTVSGLAPGTYPLHLEPAATADGSTRFLPSAGNPLQLTIVSTSFNLTFVYTTQYRVTILAGIGGEPGANSGWYAPGSTLALAASPDSTHLFSRWTGSGTGSYSGTQASQSLTVNGPITEVAQFVPAPTTSATVTSLWQNSGLLAGLLLLELAAGAVAALLLWRHRRPREESAEAPPEDPPEGAAAEPPQVDDAPELSEEPEGEGAP